MKRALLILCLAIILGISGPCLGAFAQSTPTVKQDSTKQYQSHQMNQPPPTASPRFKMSQRVIDEIAQLYELAKKEVEEKPSTPK